MKLKSILLSCVLAAAGFSAAAQAPVPQVVRQDGRHALLVDGEPFLVLGGQCGNSSNWPAVLPDVWETMEEMHANTLEIPVYWEEIEKVRGQYDFTSVQRLLDQARAHDMRLVLLWFATWKNGSNHYMPEWMKLDSGRYYNVVGKDGQPVDSPSPHAQATMELDAKAFRAFMEYLRDNDPQHTVILVQVQNEPGTWGSVRDYSKEAEKLFARPVPDALLQPAVRKELGAVADKGTWRQVFGERADEYFHAWYVASYIEQVAAAGKAVNPLPLYVNVALRDPLTDPMATEYESGGATDNVIAIYKAAAPSIAFVAPDIYQRGDERYMKAVELYDRPDNALMVPETGGGSQKYLYEVIRRGIGFAPFGVDKNRRAHAALSAEYKLLRPVARQFARWSFEGRVHTAYEPENGSKEQTLDLGEWEAVLTFGAARRGGAPAGAGAGAPAPANGKAMIVKLGEGDFLAMGTDCRFTFRPLGRNEGRAWHYLRVEEGSFDESGQWVMTRVLNGDETDWGGPYVGSAPSMLRIRVYAREPRK